MPGRQTRVENAARARRERLRINPVTPWVDEANEEAERRVRLNVGRRTLTQMIEQQQAANPWYTALATNAFAEQAATWTTATAGQPAPAGEEMFQVITNPFIGTIYYEPAERIQPIGINAKPAKEVQAKDDYDMDAGD